jgi:hypothetical protein
MNRDEVKQLIREVLVEMFFSVFKNSQQESDNQWVGLQQAWQPLGYPSYNALYKDVQAGLFRTGKELCDRRKPGAKIARLQIDLVAARKRLAQDPAKRRGV